MSSLIKVYTICHFSLHLLEALLDVKTTLVKLKDRYSNFLQVSWFLEFYYILNNRVKPVLKHIWLYGQRITITTEVIFVVYKLAS